MFNPYAELPPEAFWKPAVAQRHFSEIGPLWSPKFHLQPADRVVTFGSCFAQHIGRALQKRGFGWHCTEAPPPELSAEVSKRFNYDVFSCRTANIYTPTLLRQWLGWAFGEEPVPTEVWEQGGRFYDPFRPAIEPGGFASAEEMRRSREVTIKAFARAVRTANYFVFTLGLTESWRNGELDYEYPMCPGTVAGDFDSTRHQFKNLDMFQTISAMNDSLALMRNANRNLRVILTVSPVPLTATNSGSHVMVATMESKSVLRAVAGQLARGKSFVDYFPSYEIINAPPMQGVFFEPNRRNVSEMGVDFVMNHFFACLNGKFGSPQQAKPPVAVAAQADSSASDLVCEEELLGAFGRSGNDRGGP